MGLSLAFAVVVALTLGGDGGRRVHHRVAAREEPVGRQPVRLRADLRLLQGAARVPAPRAVLRRDRRARVPRHLPRRGRRNRQQVHRRAVRFAAVLLYSAYKLTKDDDDVVRPRQEFAIRLMRKVDPGPRRIRRHVGSSSRNSASASRPRCSPSLSRSKRRTVFAVDSVPAVLAVSDDAFIVYSSNAFAILGLRALYFLLAGMLEKFHHLSKGLAIILGFIGVKLILQASHKVSPRRSLRSRPWSASAVIVVVLAGFDPAQPVLADRRAGNSRPRRPHGGRPGADPLNDGPADCGRLRHRPSRPSMRARSAGGRRGRCAGRTPRPCGPAAHAHEIGVPVAGAARRSRGRGRG